MMMDVEHGNCKTEREKPNYADRNNLSANLPTTNTTWATRVCVCVCVCVYIYI